MLPRWHIFWGVVFSALIWWIFPETAWYNLFLIFFGAVFIDFDHYMCAVLKTRRIGLFRAFGYHKELRKQELREYNRGIKRKGDFHVFHTIESHLLVLAVGLIFEPVLYVFIGMVFHSILDLLELTYDKRIYRREFLLTNWIGRKLSK